MAIPIPDKTAVVIEVDSRCFCCFRLPSSSKKHSHSKVEKTVSEVFEKVMEKTKENTPVQPNRVRTISFSE